MKTVKIYSGLPGSGKSTAARDMVKHPHTRVVSADNFHICADGSYRFNPKLAGEAHAQCFSLFLDELAWDEEGVTVIVDNTNMQNWERAPYVLAAASYKWTVEFHHFNCSVKESTQRNIHKVPAQVIQSMATRYEEPLSFWEGERFEH